MLREMKSFNLIRLVFAYFFLVILVSPLVLFGQEVLYQEDFSDPAINNKGQDGACSPCTTGNDMGGVTNWTIDVSSTTFSAGDHFKVTNEYFESDNTDATSGSPVYWYSLTVDISCYTNVTVSTVLSRQSSNSGSGVEAFYILDGSTTSFGSLIGNGGSSPTTATTSGLSGNTIQIAIAHWGTSSTPKYRHDDVLITGEYDIAACPIPAGPISCGGFFTDSDAGTAAGTYANNINYTSTFCPTSPGELTTVTFQGLDIGAGDVLNIHEGDDLSGPLLGSVNSGTTAGFSIESYDCITFNWITDGVDDGNEGFWATVSCQVSSVNPDASDDFGDAPLICDLTSYSGSTTGNTADEPFNLSGGGTCPTLFGGTIENNSWFRFIATSTSIDILITPTSCQNIFDGIQAAIFAFDGTNFTRISECNFSDGNQDAPFSLTAFEAPLVIGDTYYVMVDGNAGANCEYTIELQSGFTSMTAAASPASVCSGSSSTLSAVNATTTDLIWFADDPAFGSSYGDPLVVSPTSSTTYTVLARGECPGTTADITVNVSPSISQITAGSQGACDAATDTYTQDIVVTYVDPPGTGTLDVNGQSFGITSSPQSITLSGLSANGAGLDVTAVFSDDASCPLTENGLVTAPVSCSVLPIELSSFSGKCVQNGVEITWVTESELNNNVFSLEKANSDLNFESLAEIDGAGNSNQMLTYRYLDRSPHIGINYYRLTQTDYDGKSETFPIIAVSNDCLTHGNKAFFKGNFLVVFVPGFTNEENIKLALYDYVGRKVLEYDEMIDHKSGQHTFMFDIGSRISKGNYLLLIMDQNTGEIHKFKINRF